MILKTIVPEHLLKLFCKTLHNQGYRIGGAEGSIYPYSDEEYLETTDDDAVIVTNYMFINTERKFYESMFFDTEEYTKEDIRRHFNEYSCEEVLYQSIANPITLKRRKTK